MINKDGSEEKDIKKNLTNPEMPETRMAVIDHQRSSIETYFYKISKIKAFNDECLRMICLIFGPRKISNLDLHAFQANSESNEKASSPMARTYF